MVETLSILVWHISFILFRVRKKLFRLKKFLSWIVFGGRSRILSQSEGRGP